MLPSLAPTTHACAASRSVTWLGVRIVPRRVAVCASARIKKSFPTLAAAKVSVAPSEVRYLYEDPDGERCPVLPLIGHLIWLIQVQWASNRYWQAKVAPPP